jgi:hypothetical protein
MLALCEHFFALCGQRYQPWVETASHTLFANLSLPSFL